MNYVKRSTNIKPIYDNAAIGHKPKKKRPTPISMRFNEVQLAKLKPYAGKQSLGVYLRDYVLKAHNIEAGGEKPKLFPDQMVKAQILREIGLSAISENLHFIRRRAESESLDNCESLNTDIQVACANVAIMRDALLRSIGVHDRRNK